MYTILEINVSLLCYIKELPISFSKSIPSFDSSRRSCSICFFADITVLSKEWKQLKNSSTFLTQNK